MDNFKKPNNRKYRPKTNGDLRPDRPQKPKFASKRHNKSEQENGLSVLGNDKLGELRKTSGFVNRGVDLSVSNKRKRQAVLSFDNVIELNEELPDSKSKKLKIKKKSKKRLIFRCFLAIFVLILLSVGYLGSKAYLSSRKIFQGGSDNKSAVLDKKIDITKLKGEGDGRINILAVGKGGGQHEGAELLDTIIIGSVDPIGKQAAMLSIPRDLYVKPSELWGMKINAVYISAYEQAINAGDTETEAEEYALGLFKSTIENISGIPIHYFMSVDFNAFRQGVDAIGGVDINVTSAVYDYSFKVAPGYGKVLDVKEGLQTFDGLTALMYARSRYTSARGDFDRSERQRALILAIKDKVLTAGTFSNPIKITQMMDAFSDNIYVDMEQKEVLRLYEIVKDIPTSQIQSVGLADPPNNFVTTGQIGEQSVVLPRAGNLEFDEIKSFIRNTLKDGFLASENASVIILNGTDTAGLATARSEELKSYGYNIIDVADAPKKGILIQ